MAPAKKQATKKKTNPSPYANYTYALWIVIGVTLGVLGSKYLKNQNTLTSVNTPEPTKIYQDVPPPLRVEDDLSTKLNEQRERADNLIASLKSSPSNEQLRKLLEIYKNILINFPNSWEWWKVADTEWLLQEGNWAAYKVTAGKVLLDHQHNLQQAYQIFDEVAHSPDTEANHYNVALDHITQHFLKIGNHQEAIYWLKFAIQLRKDDSTLARWYTFLLSELVITGEHEQTKKHAIRCIKDFEKIPNHPTFPFACYFELAMLNVFNGDYKEANNYFHQLYTGGLNDNYKNELNGLCSSKDLVQLSLDTITNAERDSLGKTLLSGLSLMDPFKAFGFATCSSQKWPFYLGDDVEPDPFPVVTKLALEGGDNEEETKLRRVVKYKEGRTLGMRCYSAFQKLPVIYYLEDALLQGPAKSILETFENRTGCNLHVPSYPYINALAFPRYSGLNTYRYENLPVYNIEKAFITSFVDSNYYHFLLEAFPQILIFLSSSEYDPSVKIIAYKSRFGDEVMLHLGLEDSIVNYQPASYRYHIKHAYIPDWYFTDSENVLNAPHDTEEYYVPSLPVILTVRDKIYSFGKITPSPMNQQNIVIFIHREEGIPRSIMGSDRFYSFLEGIVANYGYELVIHGKSGSFQSLTKQAELFSRAALVIGTHGAGLTNILFCSPGAAVIELPVYPEKVSVFSRLASALSLPYYTVPSFATYHFAKIDQLTEEMVYDTRDTIEYALALHRTKQADN